MDDGHDLDQDMLTGVYERIKADEFKTSADHTTQVLKVEQTIVGSKKPVRLLHRIIKTLVLVSHYTCTIFRMYV